MSDNAGQVKEMPLHDAAADEFTALCAVCSKKTPRQLARSQLHSSLHECA